MMNSRDYGVRVVVAYEQRRVGDVFHPPGLLRDALVRRGLVERVVAQDDDRAAPGASDKVLRPAIAKGRGR